VRVEASQLPPEMRRYCSRCREPLEDRAIIRRATFHPECSKLDRKARREYRASKRCRLCGRSARKLRRLPGASAGCVSVTQQVLDGIISTEALEEGHAKR
jgi:hypothetical protein